MGSSLSVRLTWPGGQPVETCVALSFSADAFFARYSVLNDPIQKNAFTSCDSNEYRQEVIELFITNDTAARPERYWEVEVTPHGVHVPVDAGRYLWQPLPFSMSHDVDGLD